MDTCENCGSRSFEETDSALICRDCGQANNFSFSQSSVLMEAQESLISSRYGGRVEVQNSQTPKRAKRIKKEAKLSLEGCLKAYQWIMREQLKAMCKLAKFSKTLHNRLEITLRSIWFQYLQVANEGEAPRKQYKEWFVGHGRKKSNDAATQAPKGLTLELSLCFLYLSCRYLYLPILPCDLINWARRGELFVISPFYKMPEHVQQKIVGAKSFFIIGGRSMLPTPLNLVALSNELASHLRLDIEKTSPPNHLYSLTKILERHASFIRSILPRRSMGLIRMVCAGILSKIDPKADQSNEKSKYKSTKFTMSKYLFDLGIHLPAIIIIGAQVSALLANEGKGKSANDANVEEPDEENVVWTIEDSMKVTDEEISSALHSIRNGAVINILDNAHKAVKSGSHRSLNVDGLLPYISQFRRIFYSRKTNGKDGVVDDSASRGTPSDHTPTRNSDTSGYQLRVGANNNDRACFTHLQGELIDRFSTFFLVHPLHLGNVVRSMECSIFHAYL